MLPLRCATQSYDWGVPASLDSKVLTLARANGVDAAAANTRSSDTRFAELWVGTHPSGAASVLAKSGQAGAGLGEWLGGHPEALGAKLASWQQQQGQGPLPFLMKVLSIDKALPLQAHPTTSTAKKLHQKDPKVRPSHNVAFIENIIDKECCCQLNSVCKLSRAAGGMYFHGSGKHMPPVSRDALQSSCYTVVAGSAALLISITIPTVWCNS